MFLESHITVGGDVGGSRLQVLGTPVYIIINMAMMFIVIVIIIIIISSHTVVFILWSLIAKEGAGTAGGAEAGTAAADEGRGRLRTTISKKQEEGRRESRSRRSCMLSQAIGTVDHIQEQEQDAGAMVSLSAIEQPGYEGRGEGSRSITMTGL